MADFKQIPDFPGYSITADGRVWSQKSKKYLANRSQSNGYCRVELYRNNVPRHHSVHRLVAQAFIPNPDNLPEVNHKDGDKGNNSVSNLEWSTHADNMEHAYETGLVDSKGVSHPGSKLTEDAVNYIRKYYKRGNGIELASQFGVARSTISKIVNNKRWNHV